MSVAEDRMDECWETRAGEVRQFQIRVYTHLTLRIRLPIIIDRERGAASR